MNIYSDLNSRSRDDPEYPEGFSLNFYIHKTVFLMGSLPKGGQGCQGKSQHIL